jgi:hypothetical protein
VPERPAKIAELGCELDLLGRIEEQLITNGSERNTNARPEHVLQVTIVVAEEIAA